MLIPRAILSYVCGLLSAIAVFLACVFASDLLNRLTRHHLGGFWHFIGYAAGIVLGLIVSGAVKNLIFREPTRF